MLLKLHIGIKDAIKVFTYCMIKVFNDDLLTIKVFNVVAYIIFLFILNVSHIYTQCLIIFLFILKNNISLLLLYKLLIYLFILSHLFISLILI